MDEVFGEANFLAQVVVNLNPKGRQLGEGVRDQPRVPAGLRPRRARDGARREQHRDRGASDFPLVDGDGRRYRHLPLRNTNKKFNPVTARTLHFPVWGDPDSGLVRTAPFEGGRRGRAGVRRRHAGGVAVEPAADRRAPGATWSAGGSTAATASGSTCSRRTGCTATPGGRRKKLRTIWLAEEVGSTDTAVAELKEIVGHVFESPEADRPGAADPRHHAGRRAGAGLLRGQRYDRARGRAGQRGGRRHPALRQRQLRRADPRGVQRPQRRAADRRRHHPGPAARRRARHGGGLEERPWADRAHEHQGLDRPRSPSSPVGPAGSGSRRPCRLHRAGFTAYAVARRVDRMAGLEEDGIRTFPMDVTDEASMTSGIERILADRAGSTYWSTTPATAPTAPSRTCRSTRRGGSSRSTCSGWPG